MITISLLSSKGGSGKTSLALHLAVAYVKAGHNTAVIDLDVQCSAAEWGDRRKDANPPVITAPATRLRKEMDRVKAAGCDVLVLDTPPHNGEAITLAAKYSDLILSPCRPAIMDLNAITSTVNNLAGAKAPMFVVLNAISSFGGYADAAADALNGRGIKVCPVRIGNRIAFQNALVEGRTVQETEPKSVAAMETLQLYDFTTQMVA